MQQAWDQLDVGGVIIGDLPSWRVDKMLYGGVKDSGIGREGIRFVIEEYDKTSQRSHRHSNSTVRFTLTVSASL